MGMRIWSLRHRLRVFKSRVLMTLIGNMWDEVTGGFTKLINVVFHNLYNPPGK
jgi:hypothetical protein